VSVIAGAIFLKETIEYYHIIGGLLIVTGVYGAARLNYLRNRKVKK
jgi:drug/metabolite transporter (DMT)-like permease